MSQETSTQQPDTPPRLWKSPGRVVGTLAGISLLIAVILFWTGRSKNNPHQTNAAHSLADLQTISKVSTTNLASADNFDASLISSLIGSWSREYHGKWLMTVEEGGTGSLVIKPSGQWCFLIGDRVDIQLKWSVRNGRATLRSVSGEPEAAFAASNLLFGDKRIRKIKTLTEKQLILLDEEDASEDEWTRSPSATQ